MAYFLDQLVVELERFTSGTVKKRWIKFRLKFVNVLKESRGYILTRKNSSQIFISDILSTAEDDLTDLK